MTMPNIWYIANAKSEANLAVRVIGGTYSQKYSIYQKLQPIMKRRSSKMRARKKRITWAMNRLGSGSCVTSNVMTVNVKTANREAMLTPFTKNEI
jgi:hypothetical protein